MVDKRGYSLIEVLIVVAMVGILLKLTFSNMVGFSQSKILEQTTAEIVTLVSDSQHKALSGVSHQNILQSAGVLIDSNRLVQFSTPSNYSQRIVSLDNEWSWPSQIICQNVILPDNCLGTKDCVIFAKGTGLPNTAGSFVCKDNHTNQSRMININTNGLVTVN